MGSGGALAWLVTFLVVSVVAPQLAQANFQPKGFIKVCKGRLADAKGREFLFSGWNAQDLRRDAYAYLYQGAPDKVKSRLQQAVKYQLGVARMWGHGDGGDQTLQFSPDGYDEKVFRAIDYVVHMAGKFNIRLLISMTTFWQDNDGIVMYARFAGLTYPVVQQTPYYLEQWAAKDQFWTNPSAKRYFKKHILKMLNRKNTFNGKLYKNDPAIMGWGLFNEPRCPASQQQGNGCPELVGRWHNEMTKFAKAQKTKQLFTMGQEGFFSFTSSWSTGSYKWWQQCNPYGTPDNVKPNWAGGVGQDFPTQHQYSDFMEFHTWPTNWASPDLNFAKTWIDCHARVCQTLKKPCVLGEFGRALPGNEGNMQQIKGVRNPYYKKVYSTIEYYANRHRAVSGSMFWFWLNDDQPYGNENGVKTNDPTWPIIHKHAKRMQRVSGTKIC